MENLENSQASYLKINPDNADINKGYRFADVGQGVHKDQDSLWQFVKNRMALEREQGKNETP